jgi:serine phosphatase RsbU (regulator of sigma subunit)
VPNADASQPLYETLRDDFRVVAADVRQRGARRAIGHTLSSLEAFYLTDDDRRRLAGMPAFRRGLRRTWWLIRSLLLKLTPGRRIMLAIAIWALILGGQHVSFRGGDVDFTIRLPVVSGLLLFTLLMLELKDKLIARDELEAGRKVQLALMPDEQPAIPGWDVWLYTEPANDVGGDLVDHLQLDETRHVVALGDVAGKALPAALLSVKLQATLRALAPHFASLSDLGSAVNRLLYRDGLPTRFASLVYLVLPANDGQVRLLNAGHMPPLLVKDGSVVAMPRGSMVLGIMPDAVYTEQQIDVEVGGALVIYSDGVTEAMNEAGDFFGDERLYALVRRGSGMDAQHLAALILDAVQTFVGDAVPSDDVSLLVLRRT